MLMLHFCVNTTSYILLSHNAPRQSHALVIHGSRDLTSGTLPLELDPDFVKSKTTLSDNLILLSRDALGTFLCSFALILPPLGLELVLGGDTGGGFPSYRWRSH